MWTRLELKTRAKTVLKNNYGDNVVACIIVMLITGVASSLISFIPVINFLGSLTISFFLSLPLTVGLCYFFKQNRQSAPIVKNVFYAFESSRYMSVVSAMAWCQLFIILWSLLPLGGIVIFSSKLIASSFSAKTMHNFVFDADWIVVTSLCSLIFVAGLVIVMIKSLSYSMTPYILTDNPYIGYSRALKLSIAMTNGQKWNIFVLQLSFIGWILLSALTFFIGMIFLAPYMLATQYELYEKLRDNAITKGLCSPQELNLYQAS